ncbi:DUF2147 domain-containing protein [Gilvimarinus sp. F26214L]|uniref:DUF2147 domain-containing protein n=1 Tax=Gilvimarinus sp. DZF01 TaxID=3461371 RepID=UPI00404642C2
MKNLVLLFMTFAIFPLAHGEITGTWQTIDDESGEAKSIVEIYEREGKYFGKVKDLLLKPDDTVCEECDGSLKDQPVVGMEIITDMEKDGEELTGGEILDPETGKVYRAKLWLEDDNTLKVRGYVGFLYRTQTWNRVP